MRGTPVLSLILQEERRRWAAQPRIGVPLPGTGYAAGGTPLVVSHRRTFSSFKAVTASNVFLILDNKALTGFSCCRFGAACYLMSPLLVMISA